MGEPNATILLSLTSEEAWELLARCLDSAEPDGEAFRSALQKLTAGLRAGCEDEAVRQTA